MANMHALEQYYAKLPYVNIVYFFIRQLMLIVVSNVPHYTPNITILLIYYRMSLILLFNSCHV